VGFISLFRLIPSLPGHSICFFFLFFQAVPRGSNPDLIEELGLSLENTNGVRMVIVRDGMVTAEFNPQYDSKTTWGPAVLQSAIEFVEAQSK
jgi:hypothetical protein